MRLILGACAAYWATTGLRPFVDGVLTQVTHWVQSGAFFGVSS